MSFCKTFKKFIIPIKQACNKHTMLEFYIFASYGNTLALTHTYLFNDNCDPNMGIYAFASLPFINILFNTYTTIIILSNR